MHVELMRDTATTMPSVDTSAKSLRIWHCRYKTLSPVGDLLKLRTLVIATYPDESLDLLRPLRDLRQLHILHMPKVRDLSPLAALERLEFLSLATLPSWDPSGKVTEVVSLEPIARLPALRYLGLFGVVPKPKSLAALTRCRHLMAARFSKYPKAEVRTFYEATGVSDDDLPTPRAG
jgi:hypothetical protein